MMPFRDEADFLRIADQCLDLKGPHGGPPSRRLRIARALACIAAECFDACDFHVSAKIQRECIERLTVERHGK
jgi:hypothetical protein